MTFLRKLVALSALLMAASTANAAYIPASWTDTLNTTTFLNSGRSVTYQHDLTDNGFVAGEDLISNFWLTINLEDDGDRQSEVAFVDLTGITGDRLVTNFGLSGAEYGGWSIAGLVELNLLGTLTVTVQSVYGDFFLTGSQIVANGHANVPEPGTLALMGLGLLGVGVGARRRRK